MKTSASHLKALSKSFTGKRNKERIQSVVAHLASLAEEMNLDKKNPRIVFWKKETLLKDYKERKETFKMFIGLSVAQLSA